MSAKRISQRDARTLRKRVDELARQIEAQRHAWVQSYIGGMEIGRTDYAIDHPVPVAVRTARKLRHAVVAVGDDSGTIRFVALPQAKG